MKDDQQLELPMGSGTGDEHTLCIACGLLSPLGEVFCEPCKAPLVEAGRGLKAQLTQNLRDGIRRHDRTKHRPI